MISTTKETSNLIEFDVILISGDFWSDHPHSGVGVIAKVVESQGYSVGIIEKPGWKSTADFRKLGLPRLFWGITAGAIDSMMKNYTPLKKPRSQDPYKPYSSGIPDRTIIVYSQMVRRAQKEMLKESGVSHNGQEALLRSKPIIIGGVEASLRRFTHYDYWDNALRRPILFDAKADLLVYGPGEYQVKEILSRLDTGKDLAGIEGTCVIFKQFPDGPQDTKEFNLISLPSHDTLLKDKQEFCRFSIAISNRVNLVEQVGARYLIQYRMHPYTTEELDEIYDLDFSYVISGRNEELEMARFSVITHRGCYGNCNFCSIALHQGTKIVSRSEENILKELKKISSLPTFKGYIGDLGGPSADMYGLDCPARNSCEMECISCARLNKSHSRVTNLLKKARMVPGIKKVFVRSGIRYDQVVDDDAYLDELFTHHVSGNLKIAPEHFSPRVCALMNKPNDRFEVFKAKFDAKAGAKKYFLKYYFITAHPGSTMEDAKYLKRKIRILGKKSTESIQIFTPTPMSISTCMYYTGLNPSTLEPIYVPHTYKEKKEQKRILYE